MDLVITLPEPDQRLALFGPQDRYLRQLRDQLGIKLVARDADLKLSGEPEAVTRAAVLIDQLRQIVREHGHLREEDVARTLAAVDARAVESHSGEIEVFRRDARVVARSDGQRRYVEAVMSNDLTFCLGPAGTGKTYLAVAVALSMLKRGKLRRIVLARPAVEAGEKLGFLPGDMQAKVNPYLRPLFDAMNDLMDIDQARRMMETDVIEVVPLAFMRGRTLNSAAIILDEAQNTTVMQMFMFLTRLGHHSKMIVCGDDSQIDLDPPGRSGLLDAARRLDGVERIAIVRLDNADIVRHDLVSRIVDAYKGMNGKS